MLALWTDPTRSGSAGATGPRRACIGPVGRIGGKIHHRRIHTSAVEFRLAGWPADEPTLDLDHRQFAYAGKFVTAKTGKAIVVEAAPPEGQRPGQDVLAAASFSPDRVREEQLWIRYVDVRADRRGDGIGAHLARFVVGRANDRGFEPVTIAVNNPYAYSALHKAGFGFTGEEAGLAELILSTAAERSPTRYQAGLERFQNRDLPAEVNEFLDTKIAEPPPGLVDDPGR